MPELFSLTDAARELATNLPHAAPCAMPRDGLTCLQLESARPLTKTETAAGVRKRAFGAFRAANLCGPCEAQWHAEQAAQILARLWAEAALEERLNPTQKPNAKEGT